ncbi:hypothetical protein BAZMOX_21399_0 [methanotrophic endosymbiont of Bathymodiolus azoricus (Menez Gwen)]|nr:hypothetical protein BAZMOX_21399_0 [methanotrophic endosymbiont of Bathymodiolus azoricus (Menez Gwen)]
MKWHLIMTVRIWSWLIPVGFIDSAVEESLDSIGEALARR